MTDAAPVGDAPAPDPMLSNIAAALKNAPTSAPPAPNSGETAAVSGPPEQQVQPAVHTDPMLGNIHAALAAPRPEGPPISGQEKPAAAEDVAPTNLGRAREAANLVTSGLSDKAIAAGAGLGSLVEGRGFSPGYEESLATGDPYAAKFREEHPILSASAGTAGALATAPFMPAAAASVPVRVAQGMGMGAATGAAAGYGTSTDSPVRDTLIGAGLGGMVGGMLPVVGSAVSPLLKSFKTKVPAVFPEAIEQQATEAIAKRIGQDQAAGGPGTSQMMDILSAAPTKPLSLTDVGGENLQALAGNVARQPGPGRQIMRSLFTDRDVSAGDRLIQDIDRSVAGGSSAHDAVQGLLAQRSADARPLYERAFTESPVVGSDRIQQFIQDPIMQQGLSSGVKLQRLEALADGRTFNPNDYRIDYDPDGTPRFQATPNLRTLDAAKRGLDDMLSGDTYRDSTTGRLTQMGRAIDGVRRSFVNELDAYTGGPTGSYATARAAWAGPSRAMEQIRNGQSFLSMDPDEVRDTVAALNPADRQFFQLGVADRLRQNVVDTTLNGDESKKIINSEGIKRRLRPMFSSEKSFNDFVNNVMAERLMKETGSKIIGGSSTAPRVAEDTAGSRSASFLGNLAAGAGALAAHEPFAATPMIYRGVRDLGNWMGQPSQAVNNEIARQLSRTSLPENSAILSGIGTPSQASQFLPSASSGSGGIGANLYFGERPRLTGP
jgi:hypothetical protein